MDKCLQAEKELAQLLGFTDIREGEGLLRRHTLFGTLDSERVALPRYTRNWAMCGPLMVEHDCCPTMMNNIVVINGDSSQGYEVFADHESKNFAVMYAVVKAVIAKLKVKKET